MKLHHIALTVSNLSKSLTFYQDIFGFVKQGGFKRPDMKAQAIFLQLQTIQLELWCFETSQPASEDLDSLHPIGLRHIALEVNNIKQTREMIISNGLQVSEIKTAPTGFRYCFTADPDGIPLELIQA